MCSFVWDTVVSDMPRRVQLTITRLFLTVLAASCSFAFDAISILRSEHDTYVVDLRLGDVEHLIADAVFDTYTDERTALLDAREQLQVWITSHSPAEYDAHDTDLDRLVRQDQRVADRTLQLGLRDLETWYFTMLGEIRVGLAEAADTLARRHRRQRVLQSATLPHDCPAGVDVDLQVLVDDRFPTAALDEPLRDLVEAYERELEPLVESLDQFSMRDQSDLSSRLRAIHTMASDPSASEADLDAAVTETVTWCSEPFVACHEVRGVNQRYAELIIDALPEDEQLAFDRTVRRRLSSYVQMTGPRNTERLLNDLRSRPNLDAETQESLENLKQWFDLECETAASRATSLYEELVSPPMYAIGTEAWIRSVCLDENHTDPRDDLQRDLTEVLDAWNDACAKIADLARQLDR